jgi:hypothetical protein
VGNDRDRHAAGTLASAGINVGDTSAFRLPPGALPANDGAEGRLEAIQIGNQIASSRWRSSSSAVAAAQMSAQNVYLGARRRRTPFRRAFDACLRTRHHHPVSRNEGVGVFRGLGLRRDERLMTSILTDR